MSDRDFITAPPRRRRKRRPPTTPPPPTPGLALLAAAFAPGGRGEEPTLTLAFDFAIDVSAYAGNGVLVEDAPGGTKYLAMGPVTQTGSASVRVGLIAYEPGPVGLDVTLAAPATTGIKAFGGTATWAGCAGLLLPFGGGSRR